MSHAINLRESVAQAKLADAAWMDELRRVHPRLVNARYLPEGKGKPGTLLAALHAFRMASLHAMHDAFAAARSEA